MGDAPSSHILKFAVEGREKVKRQIAEMAVKLRELADSDALQSALFQAGLHEKGWVRL